MDPLNPSRRQPNESSRFAAFIETAVDAIVTIDERGRIVSANLSCERLFGYAQVELVGRKVNALMPEPYAAEHDGYISQYLQTGIAKIIGLSREVQGLRKDCSTFPLHLSVSEVKSDSQRRFFMGVIRDLTEHKATEHALRVSEARYRSVIDTANIIVLQLSPEGRLLEWNQEAERAFGCLRGAPAVAQIGAQLLAEEQREPMLQQLREALAGRVLQGYETEMTIRSGELRSLLWNASPLVDETGKMTGVIACGQDITGYKLLLDRYVKKEALAKLGQLAAVVAHEVRNPIAGIAGALKILERRTENRGDREIIQVMLERLSGLDNIVNDLLIYARPIELESVPLPLEALFDDLRLLLSEDPIFQGIALTAEGLDVTLRGDPERLKPVFLNLLLNAAQAMGGRGSIHVSARVSAGRCHIAFRDEGPGVPPELRERLFEPFFSTKTRGTGLGLASARKIIELHGGSIQFEFPGRGTTVRVDLPT